MAKRAKPMRCTKCDVEMNHHADKLVLPAGGDERLVDADLGGVIQETHGCPACGNVEFRAAASE